MIHKSDRYDSNKQYDEYKRNEQSTKFYKSTAWQRCRDLALKRDNYLCQDCFEQRIIKQAEMVHHLVEVKDDITKALELDNLISLCNPCHNKRHSVNGELKEKIKRKNISVVVAEPNREVY